MHRQLMRWYREHGRHDLPWRQTRDPYAVLVSEVMLQQTQADRVAPYYTRWMARWPGVAELGQASAAEVIREWAGLGYNRRALHLQGAARVVIARHGGVFPQSVGDLRQLPGVGPYTAAAVATFAYGERVAPVDTNIGRVIARAVVGVETSRKVGAGDLQRAADGLLPARGAREHNLALMDLGAMICTSRRPVCEACPLRRTCAWQVAGRPESEAASVLPRARFEETSRFARGRIVEALRERTAAECEELRELLPEGHRARVGGYLAGLARDGLVVERDGLWSLPA